MGYPITGWETRRPRRAGSPREALKRKKAEARETIVILLDFNNTNTKTISL